MSLETTLKRNGWALDFGDGNIFKVPCGLATTNSTIESYNKIIKLLYTNYISYSIYEIFNVILDKLVSYNSVQAKEFLYYREPNKKMKDKFKSLSRDLIVEVSANLFNYSNKYCLRYEPHNIYRSFQYVSCNCLCFYNIYICKHALLLADKLNLRLKGFTREEVFATNNKRGPKKKSKSNPLAFS